MIALLLLMLFLGPTQVLWAIIASATTESPEKRRHWLLYLGGVFIYFVSVGLVGSAYYDSSIFRPELDIYNVLFYGGAWALAIYHFVIAAMPVARKLSPDAFDLHQNA